MSDGTPPCCRHWQYEGSFRGERTRHFLTVLGARCVAGRWSWWAVWGVQGCRFTALASTGLAWTLKGWKGSLQHLCRWVTSLLSRWRHCSLPYCGSHHGCEGHWNRNGKLETENVLLSWISIVGTAWNRFVIEESRIYRGNKERYCGNKDRYHGNKDRYRGNKDGYRGKWNRILVLQSRIFAIVLFFSLNFLTIFTTT